MKELNIVAPEGYVVDKDKSTFDKIIFRKVEESTLPKSWEELGTVSGYYAGTQTKFEIVTDNDPHNPHRGLFPTREEAEASVALAQLCQLRARYNDGWKPNWDDYNEPKYTINPIKLHRSTNYTLPCQLAFKTRELRDEFYHNFKSLILIASPLL